MNPITHFLASWALAERVAPDARDRSLITWAGVLPDVDAVGAIADVTRSLTGAGAATDYGALHHVVLHGLGAALAIPALLACFGVRRARVFAGGFVAVHLHLLCDLVGSRGPRPGDIWPLWYLGPFRNQPVLFWHGQWPLNAWPNVLFTMLLAAYALWAGVARGRTPVGVFSRRADAAVVQTLRRRWAAWRA